MAFSTSPISRLGLYGGPRGNRSFSAKTSSVPTYITAEADAQTWEWTDPTAQAWKWRDPDSLALTWRDPDAQSWRP